MARAARPRYYSTDMNDYYATLELARGATDGEIKANYRRLAMKWHPDRNGGSAQAEETFKRVSEAYSVLSEAASRRAYDESLDSGRDGNAERDRAWEFSGFSAERAASMFMNEMYNLAIELTMQNVGWRDIAAELGRRGCPEAAAADIARRIEERRKAMVRGRASSYFLRSGLSGLLGLVLIGPLGRAGFGLFGFIGLIMFLSGAYNLARAIFYMTTGKAPRTLTF
jgi:curved DNA-binding protein CbpA